MISVRQLVQRAVISGPGARRGGQDRESRDNYLIVLSRHQNEVKPAVGSLVERKFYQSIFRFSDARGSVAAH